MTEKKKSIKKAVKKIAKKTAKKAVKKAVKKAPKKAERVDPLKEDRAFAIEAARIARNRNCTDVTVLDLTGISPATYFYVIATGTSDRQSRTVADEISKVAKERGHRRYGMAGYEHGQWILLDFVTVVVHIFDAQHRDYYNLEMLWGDAKHLSTDEPVQ